MKKPTKPAEVSGAGGVRGRTKTSVKPPKATPPRRTQLERSEDTRNKLLAAAVKVMVRRGFLGFTTQEAAEVAGVTRGAPLHHFRTTQAFLLAALERAFADSRRQSELRASRISSSDSADEVLRVLVEDARAFFFGDQFFLGFDALNSASKSSRMRARVRELAYRFRSAVETMWRDLFVARGFSEEVAEDIVWMTLTLVRGLAMRSSFQHNSERIERSIVIGVDLIKIYMRQAEHRPIS